jgi:diphosphomevalonate decarboxylase
MNQNPKTATAVACANIALIKYWGKRNIALNLPAVGSISLTLEALKTQTRVTFDPTFEKDNLIINNQQASESQRERAANFLDIIREKSGISHYAEILSENNFPTGAGLASSASAFASLTLSATHAAGLNLNKKDLSGISRIGSGSAARSIYGGIVEMQKGKNQSGEEDFAVQLAPQDYWDLRLLILVTSKKEKKIGSTEAMKISAETSPYYKDWIDSSTKDLVEMRETIQTRDFEKLGDLAEYSALKMHALTLSSKPPILFWNSKTLELIEEVRKLRHDGIPAYFTIDAGPQVKVITLPDHINFLKKYFQSFRGIDDMIESKLGPDAKIIGDDN